MSQLAKFHEKAIALYGCQQIAEGVSVINDAPTGTITTTAGSAAVTGTGTAFQTEVAVGSYLYDTTGLLIVGQVIAIASNTALTLDAVVPASPVAQAPGVMAISGAITNGAFKTGLGPKNAIAVLNLNFSVELASEAFQYSGDELDRDEATNITDTSAKFDYETFLPTRGTMAGSAPIESEIPLADWYQACGFALTLATGAYTISNSAASNAVMTVEVRRASPDITTQKAYVCTDVRGTLDLDLNTGSKPKFKFNMLGNLGSIVQKLTFVPNFRNIKSDLSPAIKVETIGLSALDLYSGSTEPAASGSSNVCFEKLSAPNVSGWEYNRYLMSCLNGWSKGATPTDLTLTVLEDSALATYDPYSEIENDHRLTLEYSDSAASPTAGKRIQIIAHKIKLTKVTQSKVANFAGLDLGFRNVGYTDIKFY